MVASFTHTLARRFYIKILPVIQAVAMAPKQPAHRHVMRVTETVIICIEYITRLLL